jgi:ribokinase
MRSFVIGNIALDETFSVPEMPQAGVSIHGRIVSRDLGGKGANQAIAMARAGLATTLVAAVGEDARAGVIRAGLEAEPVVAKLIGLAGAASDLSVIFTTPDGENAIVTTTEAADALTLREACNALVGSEPGDILVMQGNLAEETTRGALAEAKRRGLTTAFNPSPLRAYFAGLWPLVDIAVLNAGEANALTGAERGDAARRLRESGVSQVALTLGREGALLFGDAGEAAVPAARAAPIDTTGAGDVFLGATVASSALRGVPIDLSALRHAAEAAGIAVGRKGARSSFPTREEFAAIFMR